MQLSVTERERLYAILEKYDQNPKVQQMREFIQHGDVTTYQHCKNVVLVSCWLNHRLHLGADETSLAVGAFLHDFYLYDWHKKVLSMVSAACSRCTASPTRAAPASMQNRCSISPKRNRASFQPHVAADLPSCAQLPRGHHRLPCR